MMILGPYSIVFHAVVVFDLFFFHFMNMIFCQIDCCGPQAGRQAGAPYSPASLIDLLMCNILASCMCSFCWTVVAVVTGLTNWPSSFTQTWRPV